MNSSDLPSVDELAAKIKIALAETLISNNLSLADFEQAIASNDLSKVAHIFKEGGDKKKSDSFDFVNNAKAVGLTAGGATLVPPVAAGALAGAGGIHLYRQWHDSLKKIQEQEEMRNRIDLARMQLEAELNERRAGGQQV